MKILKKDKTSTRLKADDFRPDAPADLKSDATAGIYLGPVINSRSFSLKRVGIFGAVLAVGALLIGLIVFSLQFSRAPSCDNTTLKQYNRAVRSVDDYHNSLKELTQQIESNANYKKDITCTYMVYTRYASKQNAGKSRELLEVMKALYKDGARIDTGLLDQKSLQKEEEYVKLLEYSRDLKDGGEGRG